MIEKHHFFSDKRQFSGDKSKVLHLEKKNQMHSHRIDGTGLNKSNCEKDLRILLHNHLNMCQLQLPKKLEG